MGMRAIELTLERSRKTFAIVVAIALLAAPFASFSVPRCLDHIKDVHSASANIDLESVVRAALGEEPIQTHGEPFADGVTDHLDGCCIQSCNACASPILATILSIPTSSGSNAPQRHYSDKIAGLDLPPTLDPPRPVA